MWGLRADTSSHLNQLHPKPNIILQESGALKEFKRAQSRVILTVDKEVSMVVMDRTDYVSKAQELIGDQDTYRAISKDH